MNWLAVVAAFVAGAGLGVWLRWKWPVRKAIEVLKGARFRVRRSDGKMMYVGDNPNAAREVYNTMLLLRGQHLDFYEYDKWRGKREA